MRVPLARRIESIVPRRAGAFGGKARNLAAMARAGFPVPAAWALDASAGASFLAKALSPAEQPAVLLAAPERQVGEARLAELAARLKEAPIPEDVARALREVWRALIAEGASAVAVRSSSAWEDTHASSAAGLHETVLGVASERALFDAARACWASVLSPTAFAHFRAHGVDATNAGIGLVVQAMVPAEVSGALFTVNPLSGDPGEMLVNATYGLGCALMDGRVSPDTYRVDKASGWVRDRVLGDKGIAVRWSAEAGLYDEAVDDEMALRECLDEAMLEALVELGRRVEQHFDDARDIEWAFVGGSLYLLQARPVTALAVHPRRPGRRSRQKDRAQLVWSNVNVGEALPGAATPLTWSILSDFSERGFRRAFGSLGCSVPRDAELVGSFRGRIYLNLTEFTAIASQVPGLTPRALLSLGGGGGLEALEIGLEEQSSTGFFLRLPLTVGRYVRENIGLTQRIASFEQAFDDEHGKLASVDPRVLSSTGLDRVLRRVERLLDLAGLSMLQVYGNLLATVVLLRAVLRFRFGDDAARFERALFTGLTDVESAAPGLALFHIAETARAEPEARARLEAGEASALRLHDLPDGPTRRALSRFLAAYGFRGAREAEIAEPRWRESPGLLFAAIKAHLNRPAGMPSPLDLEVRQRAVREGASAELEHRLFGPPRLAVRHLLGLVQRFTRLRERMRAHVVKVLGLYRMVGLDASRRLAALEPEVGRDAAFYLSVEELHAFLKGDVGAIGPLVRRRRQQFERDRDLPDPPDTFVGYPPPIEVGPVEGDVLRGLAAASGRARGRARVLRDASEAGSLEAGEILVVPYADVGLSPLFLVAAAVVTDLGGPLSHAAVVAREYGVPTVVNVKRATVSVQTGDQIEVDGDAGTVRVISRAAGRPLEVA